MNQKKKVISATAIVSITVILAAIGSQIGEDKTYVSIEVHPPKNYQGQTFIIPIYCAQTQPIKAFEFSIKYNPKVLKAIKVDEGDVFKANQTFFNPGTINNEEGEIKYIYDLIIGKGITTQINELVVITFEAIGIGTSNITFEGLGITNNTNYIPIIYKNGQIRIYSNCDMDMNGLVNIFDLVDVAKHFGEKGTNGWIKEDINKDGQIGIMDLVLIIKSLTQS